MRTVWKKVLPIDDEVIISWPRHSYITLIGAQGNDLCVWFVCDPDNERVLKTFRITGTGHPAPEGLSGAWTVPMPSGLVWHVWDSGEWTPEEQR